MSSSLNIAKLTELQRRLSMRADFEQWCRANLLDGQQPAKHHLLIINILNRLVNNTLKLNDGRTAKRLIIMLPPGAAKSTYTSWLFPPWFLNLKPNLTILACSYAYDLVEKFGGMCRNLILNTGHLLGYSLNKDSKSKGEWQTSNGGRYFCAGVNAGIAGHRADLGLIDDPIGTEMDAQSKPFRDHLWDWYLKDFVPRLKPQAHRVIICNRRHEDDLVGRLLDPRFPANEASDWFVLSLPMEAEANDVLGRKPGERLWPEWFTETQVSDAKKDPRTWAGLYQQHPTPESGDFFHRSWIRTYDSPSQLPSNLRIYVTSDHACSTERNANLNCFLPFGIDEDNHIWILPDVYWTTATPLDSVNAMFEIVERRHPIKWVAEKGHISKSLQPLIEKLMAERGTFFLLEQITPAGDKRARCGAIAGRMQQGMVHFPSFWHQWPDALFEMMSFTGSGDDKSDDFCDALGHAGMMMMKMTKPGVVVGVKPQFSLDNIPPLVPTLGWLKQSSERIDRAQRAVWQDK